MAEQTPEFVLILKSLVDLREDIKAFSEDFRDHVEKDMDQFTMLHSEISKARGAAMIIIPLVSAIVSVLVGYVIKHF